MKKIFIISLVLLIVVMVFLGIYNIAFKKSEEPVIREADQKEQIKKTMPAAEVGVIKSEKITAISSIEVVGAVFDKKNDAILYYSAKDGTTWKSDPNGKNIMQTSQTKVLGIKNVLWSPDKSKVLTTVEKEGKLVFYEYDTIAQKAVELKNGLDTAVWDNMGAKILYKYFDQTTKIRTLNIANPDGSDWQKITDIDFRNISISRIPLTSLVSFWNYPLADAETQLMSVGVAVGDEPRTIFKGKFGADYSWSPNGSLALISSLNEKDGKKITLGTVNLKGEYNDLNIPTVVSKAVWSSDSKIIYYAVAGGIPETAIMPNDYYDGKFTTKDTFWKLDITTGKKERLVEPEDVSAVYDANNLFLSPTEDTLYFINKIDGKLYKIAL